MNQINWTSKMQWSGKMGQGAVAFKLVQRGRGWQGWQGWQGCLEALAALTALAIQQKEWVPTVTTAAAH